MDYLKLNLCRDRPTKVQLLESSVCIFVTFQVYVSIKVHVVEKVANITNLQHRVSPYLTSQWCPPFQALGWILDS